VKEATKKGSSSAAVVAERCRWMVDVDVDVDVEMWCWVLAGFMENPNFFWPFLKFRNR
jgi:hypothetical protein